MPTYYPPGKRRGHPFYIVRGWIDGEQHEVRTDSQNKKGEHGAEACWENYKRRIRAERGTPRRLGRSLAVQKFHKKWKHLPPVLHTLIFIAGVSRADVAKVTGLTRGRIGHYLNLREPVPDDRERQFYELLHDITEGYEAALTDLDLNLVHLNEPRLVRAAVSVVREIVKACHTALADYEAAHHPKDDTDNGAVA